MRYILDNEGYVSHITFDYLIECDNKTCTEYEGTVPKGYSSLKEWSEQANIKAYKIVNGNLTYDEKRDIKLQEQYELEGELNEFATKSYVNEKLNKNITIYDENIAKTTNDLLITDSIESEIPEIIIKGKGNIKTNTDGYIEDARSLPVESLIVEGKSEQEIPITGKNICPTDFDIEWVQGQYTLSGAIDTVANRIRVKRLIDVLPNTTYYVNTFSNGKYPFALRGYNSNGVFYRSIGAPGDGTTFTTKDGETKIGITIYSSESGVTFDTYKTCFEDGAIKPFICLNSEIEKTFEEYIPNGISPDYPSEVKTIKGIENLFDKNDTLNPIHASSEYISTNYIKIKKGDTLYKTNKVMWWFYNSSKEELGTKTGGNSVLVDIDNVAYVRCNVLVTELDKFMLTINQPLPNSYIPYGRWLPVKARGKNICPTDISMWESGQYHTDGTKGTHTARIRTIDLLPVSQNTYIARCSSYSTIIRTYDKDKKFVRSLGVVSTFIINENEKYIGVTLGESTGKVTFETYQNGFANGTIQPFIYLNSEENKTFESYKETISLLDMNKENLFDKDNANTINGFNSSSAIGTTNGVKTLYIPIEENKTYTISKVLSASFSTFFTSVVPDIGVALISSQNHADATTITRTAPSGAKYLCVYYYYSVQDTLTEEAIRSSVKIYEGIGTNDYYEFASINDVEDTYELVSGKLNQKIGKIVLDGSETWYKNESYESLFYTATNLIPDMDNISNVFISDYYPYIGVVQASSQINKVGLYNFSSTTLLKRITVKHNENLTLEEYKAWLSENPVTVYYILAEPKTIQQKPTNLELINGVNHISVEDDLKPTAITNYRSQKTTFSDGIKAHITNDNILPIESTNQTVNGLNFTINEDKTISISGTATADTEFILNGSMDNIDPIFIFDALNNLDGTEKVNHYISGLSENVTLNLYNYNGTSRELVYSGTGGEFGLTENKYVTCSTLQILKGAAVNTTVSPMIKKQDESTEYVEAKKNDFLTTVVTELDEDEYLKIDRYYVKLADGKKESILKPINTFNSFDKTLISLNSPDLSVSTKYYDNKNVSEKIADLNSKIEVTAEEITSEVSSTYITKVESETNINSAKTEAINSSNATTDSKLGNYTNTSGMNTAIDNAKNEAINSANTSTDNKLKNYSTTAQMNSAITQKSNEITSSVSATYITKTDSATNISTAKTEAINSSNTATDNKLKSYSTTTQMTNAISQAVTSSENSIKAAVNTQISELDEAVSGELELKVSKNDNNQIVSMLNASVDEINLSGDRFVVNSSNLQITKDGSLSVSNANDNVFNFKLSGNGAQGYSKVDWNAGRMLWTTDDGGSMQFNMMLPTPIIGLNTKDGNRTNVNAQYIETALIKTRAVSGGGDDIPVGNLNIKSDAGKSDMAGDGAIFLNAEGNITLCAGDGKGAYVRIGENGSSYKINTAGGNISSKNLKENLEEFTDNEYEEALSLLKDIKLYNYDYKYNINDYDNNFGFVIDEVEENELSKKFFNFESTKAVATENGLDEQKADEDPDNENIIEYKKYNQETLIKYLLTCCKAMQKEIEELKKK